MRKKGKPLRTTKSRRRCASVTARREDSARRAYHPAGLAECRTRGRNPYTTEKRRAIKSSHIYVYAFFLFKKHEHTQPSNPTAQHQSPQARHRKHNHGRRSTTIPSPAAQSPNTGNTHQHCISTICSTPHQSPPQQHKRHQPTPVPTPAAQSPTPANTNRSASDTITTSAHQSAPQPYLHQREQTQNTPPAAQSPPAHGKLQPSTAISDHRPH